VGVRGWAWASKEPAGWRFRESKDPSYLAEHPAIDGSGWVPALGDVEPNRGTDPPGGIERGRFSRGFWPPVTALANLQGASAWRTLGRLVGLGHNCETTS